MHVSHEPPANERNERPGPRGPVSEQVPARKRPWWLVVVALGAVASVLWLRRPGKEQAPAAAPSASPENRPVPVVVAAVEQRDVPIYLEGLGNAVPLATVNVKSQVDGPLNKVLFREGQAVKRGEVLAQIDPRPFVIALHLAQAALARDSAQARNAKLNLERYQNLVGQKLIPQQQVDDQQTLLDQAKAAMASDQAQIENAKLQLDYASIKSPLDGVTGVRLVDPGNIVHASDQGGIVVVTQLDPMAVLFTLPQDDLARVLTELAKNPLTVEAYTRDLGKRAGTGKLELVDNQVNQATATIRLKAIFPNPDKTLWPNEFLKVRLLLATKPGALVVPAPALQRGPQGPFVYVVDAAQKATIRPVQIDSLQGELAIIASGLAPGDSVVVEGQAGLRPGAKVAARAPTAPESGRAKPAGSSAPPREGSPAGGADR